MNIIPKFASIPIACSIIGLGRTSLYNEAGKGSFKVVKAGGKPLVDMESALAWMATLPLAQIAAPKTKAA